MKKIFIFLLFFLIFASGCVNQKAVIEKALNIEMKAEPSQVFPSGNVTLYIDLENKDKRYWKVFVDVYETGLFDVVEGNKAKTIGSLKLHEKNCTHSLECFDEDFGGCGVCDNGKCVPSHRKQRVGDKCDKTCQCMPNENLGCRYDTKLKKNTCQKLEGTCIGGTPRNKCAKLQADPPYYCDEFGESFSMCQGPDRILGDETEVGKYASKDDCGCPADKICRGDGTCGFMNQCFATIYDFSPGDIKTIECKLRAKDVPRTTTSNIFMRLRLTSHISMPILMEFISEKEFRKMIAQRPSLYEFKDKNVKLVVEFTEKSPIVIRDKKIYAHITIKNIGDGFIYPIGPNDFFITQDKEIITNCNIKNPPTILRPIGDEFPRITCELSLPPETDYITYLSTINLYYSYEIRKSLPISIIK